MNRTEIRYEEKEKLIMDQGKTNITVIAKPGNFCHSLFAILKTLPEVDLTLYESLIQNKENQRYDDVNLVIVDRVIIHKDPVSNLRKLNMIFPNAKIMLIEDRLRYSPFHIMPEVDFVISKSASAGEFLLMIKRLTKLQPTFSPTATIASGQYYKSLEPRIAH
jgi:hypothetical protein